MPNMPWNGEDYTTKMTMTVQLNIESDQELRAAIRDSIKGEVLSIARGEIKKIIAEVVGEKVIPKNPAELDVMVREIVRTEVRTFLDTRNAMNTRILERYTKEAINAFLQEAWATRPPRAE